MKRPEDLSGREFGRLTAISIAGKSGTKILWLCKCSCGSMATKSANILKRGDAMSCGCLRRETAAIRHTTHGEAPRGNGVSPEYRTWQAMKNRCLNPRQINYINYGARGITVCERWINSFEAFLEDMGRKPSPGHSIDRIDNDAGYFPENCKWATRKEQNMNTRRSRK